MEISNLLPVLTNLLPTLAVLVAVLSMFIFLTKGSIQFGNIKFDFEGKSGERLKKEIEEKIAKGSSPQNALMQEYHEQGISQYRISFWFSLVFASIGFAIIALSVAIFLQGTNGKDGWAESAGKPIFTLVAGTVIDAVAALFFCSVK
jgi:hypothetical protein